MVKSRTLLSIIELGGYPDFCELYEKCGYQVESVSSMRKAIRSLKQNIPSVIVAEFNFQSDFRDRTSNLETLMAAMQQIQVQQIQQQQESDIKLIIFYEKEYLHQFEKLRQRFKFHAELAYPIDTDVLSSALKAES